MSIKINPTSNIAKLIIVVELILVVYLLNTLTVSVYKGYQIDLVIAQYESENRRIEQENRQKSEDYDYFSSPNYIEKIAKQNLGLINYGEEVIILSKNDSVGTVQDVYNVNDDNQLVEMSNAEKWWIFFFDRNGVVL